MALLKGQQMVQLTAMWTGLKKGQPMARLRGQLMVLWTARRWVQLTVLRRARQREHWMARE